MAMKRRDAREQAFALLFEHTFYPEKDVRVFYAEKSELCGIEEDGYLRAAVIGAAENAPKEDGLIEKYSNGWKVRRISRASLAIMRLCIYEMLFIEEIPFNVSINEAVELCKKYDDDKAPAFVNGILNAIAEKEGIK